MPGKEQNWDELMAPANAGLAQLGKMGAEIDKSLNVYAERVETHRKNAVTRDSQIAQVSSDGLKKIEELEKKYQKEA